jgi:1-acyl-sn-glycerol-3-phosphate acyltransferase
VTLLDDVRLLRSGFNWGAPRPRSWPEAASAVPERPSNLQWARQEPVRTLRYLIQRGVMMPFNELMTHPRVEGAEWVRDLDRSVIFAANHTSHADTPLLLHALGDRVRERTVVAAAADYFYERPWLGRIVSLYLNTFPFARSGGAGGVLHAAGQLLRSGWHLLLYPEGTRTTDGSLGEFKPGLGYLATETRTPVVPMHLRGTLRVMPKGRRVPLPAPVTIRIGKPLVPERKEGSREFTKRVEAAVRRLASGTGREEVTGSWVERWRQTAPRDIRL